MKKLAIIAGLSVILAACSIVPDELATSNEEQLVSYQQASSSSAQVVGEQARWGGVIADVRNGEQFTIIEMVNFPLKGWGRPTVSDDSEGRFLAVIDGFVDPTVYEQGRQLTVLGTLEETREGKIDDYVYTYPVVKVSGYKLWKKQSNKATSQINYAPLWFRHNFYAPYPYKPYYYYPRSGKQAPKKDNSGNPGKERQ